MRSANSKGFKTTGYKTRWWRWTRHVFCARLDMVGATKNSTSRDVNTTPFQAQQLTALHVGPATYRKSIWSATCSGAMGLDHTALHSRAWGAGWRTCEATRTGWHPILCRMCVRPETRSTLLVPVKRQILEWGIERNSQTVPRHLHTGAVVHTGSSTG